MYPQSSKQIGQYSCADLGIFVRGGQGQSCKKSSDNVVFVFFPAYFTEVKRSISKKSIIFQGSRGGPTFSRGGGSNFFQGGGSNYVFPIETHITCDFPGGPDPLSPLWIRTWYFKNAPYGNLSGFPQIIESKIP